MLDHLTHELEPKERKLSENEALVGNGGGHDDVKSRNAVRGDNQQGIVEIVDIPDLAAGMQFETWEMGLVNRLATHCFLPLGNRVSWRQERVDPFALHLLS